MDWPTYTMTTSSSTTVLSNQWSWTSTSSHYNQPVSLERSNLTVSQVSCYMNPHSVQVRWVEDYGYGFGPQYRDHTRILHDVSREAKQNLIREIEYRDFPNRDAFEATIMACLL